MLVDIAYVLLIIALTASWCWITVLAAGPGLPWLGRAVLACLGLGMAGIAGRVAFILAS